MLLQTINDVTYMSEKKNYTEKQEKLVHFAKALGHPARVAVNVIPCQAGRALFRGDTRGTAYRKGYCVAASCGIERRGTDTGNDRNAKVKYCINSENWVLARELFKEFWEMEIMDADSDCRQV